MKVIRLDCFLDSLFEKVRNLTKIPKEFKQTDREKGRDQQGLRNAQSQHLKACQVFASLLSSPLHVPLFPLVPDKLSSFARKLGYQEIQKCISKFSGPGEILSIFALINSKNPGRKGVLFITTYPTRVTNFFYS